MNTVRGRQGKLTLLSIIWSSTFSDSFSLAKYSCNPFLLLSVAFLLGEVLGLKVQSPDLVEICLDEMTCGVGGSVALVGLSLTEPPFLKKQWSKLLYPVAYFTSSPSLCLVHTSFLSATRS